MQTALISPCALRGTVKVPPSKSAAHRALICAGLAHGVSRISPFADSDDIRATAGAISALGADIASDASGFTVRGGCPLRGEVLDCGESGSTLRFLIPVAAVLGGSFVFTGRGRLPSRPIGPYLELLPSHGAACSPSGPGLPLGMTGRLRGGRFSLPGNISSQFVTGLLLALPLAQEDSVIDLTTPLESSSYVDMTLDIMSAFGAAAQRGGSSFSVRGRQNYRARDFVIEGDWSQAAFWLCAGALGGGVSCSGLDGASRQGDRAVLPLLSAFGANTGSPQGCFSASPGRLSAADIDASGIPDLVPILAALACFAQGRTRIYNAARLRIKESDRLAASAAGLSALGGNISETADGLEITGGPMRGGRAESFGDHRIAMALSIAAAFCEGPSEIRGCECVNKSYPGFYNDFKMLGGKADVVSLG
jgi:3-phosphoshikimate 1-carboxyvinyltransferase